MAERKAFLLRLDAADFEALRRWADDEFRSLNGQIEFLLRQALVRHRGFRPVAAAPDPPQSAADS